MKNKLFCAVRQSDGFRGLPTFDFNLAQQEASQLGLQWKVEIVDFERLQVIPMTEAQKQEALAEMYRDLDNEQQLSARDIEEMAEADERQGIRGVSRQQEDDAVEEMRADSHFV